MKRAAWLLVGSACQLVFVFWGLDYLEARLPPWLYLVTLFGFLAFGLYQLVKLWPFTKQPPSPPIGDAIYHEEITRILWHVQGTGQVPESTSFGKLTLDTMLVNGFIERAGWNPVAPRYRVSKRGWYFVQHGAVPEAGDVGRR